MNNLKVPTDETIKGKISCRDYSYEDLKNLIKNENKEARFKALEKIFKTRGTGKHNVVNGNIKDKAFDKLRKEDS
jgi:hypothetical protein